ncbi:MAG: glycine betaine/L-proline ABC transporter permease ProW [Brachymonas sp.]
MRQDEQDPWGSATEADTSGNDLWSQTTTSDGEPSVGQDPYAEPPPPESSDSWLNGPDSVPSSDFTEAASAADSASPANHDFAFSQLWDGSLPVQDWINNGLQWVVDHFRPFFQSVRAPVDSLLSGIEAALQYPSPLVMIGILSLIAWQLSGRSMAIATLLGLLAISVLGIWSEAMVTLSLVLTSLFFCIVLGLPLGILLARSNLAQKTIRPVLDAMQTTPAFVYLVPVVMLFGIGNVPGVIVTVIFALPPLVRLTNLGIRQVRSDLVEAARAYGASPWQLLTKVQLPLAMPSIMAGVNQALMLSLSMVVIASMIAVGGLGLMVLRGIGRLDMGLATVGGLGIVILAIVLDRLTQSMGKVHRHGEHWYMRGPVGLIGRLFKRPLSTTA